MRLLNASDYSLGTFNDERELPPYAILSHTWDKAEITFSSLTRLTRDQLVREDGFEKIARCCAQTLRWELQWVWMDTCCIDQSSSAELSEAVNSMFRWYRQSAVCFAYLYDVDAIEKDFADSSPIDAATHKSNVESFNDARWFKRGWCLQELLAPPNLHFYNKNWAYIGSKDGLKSHVSEITGIDEYGMLIPDLSVLSVAHRMSWVGDRETTRKEDIAYCLLGIFNINMPLLYGEGEVKAFYRLQEEIVRRVEDHSIFAWHGDGIDFGNDMVGLLARHPRAFSYRKHKKVLLREMPTRVEPLSITGRGIRAEVPLISLEASEDNYAAVIGCGDPNEPDTYYAVPVTRLKQRSDVYRDVFRRTSPELRTISLADVRSAELSSIFLLRQNMPTHLEDKKTMQVWFSLLETKDCIYRVDSVFPSSHWNTDRRVFAFLPSDFNGVPQMVVIFKDMKDEGFVLRIDLDLIEGQSTLRLTRLHCTSPIKEGFLSADEVAPEILLGEKPQDIRSQLSLGRRSVTASVERNHVYEQDLYEVKVNILQEAMV